MCVVVRTKVLAIGGVLVACTVPSVAETAASARTSLVIRLESVTTSSRLVNQPPHALGKGDTLTVRDNLYNLVRQFGRRAGALVGRDRVTIRFKSATTATYVGTATLPDGTIRIRGVVAKNDPPSVVTGGTGRYAGAQGTMVEPGTSTNPNKAANVYRLVLR